MMQAAWSPALALRFALREMRGGLRGFLVFIACIALGTGAIAAINSISATVSRTMETEGRQLLAGDIRFELTNREASPQERTWLEQKGTVSHTTTLRSMVRRPDGSDQSLAELKAVDSAYPLYGVVKANPTGDLQALLQKDEQEIFGALAHKGLLDRLALKVGDRVLLGNIPVRIAAVLDNEPDAVSEGFGFAPRLLLAGEALKQTGLVQVGSLTKEAYRLRLPAAVDPETLRKSADRAFPDAGWSVRSSRNAAPSLAENINRFTQFLTLVGLTALIVGGVGIGNAVRAYLESRRSTIATFKCLGAPAGLITAIYFLQVLLVSLLGIGFGLAIGIVAPVIAMPYLASILPVDGAFRIYPSALALATGFGLVTTIAFSILPLGAARRISAVTLFRDGDAADEGWPALRDLLALSLVLALLAGLAIYTAADRRIAINALIAIAVGFVALRLVGRAVQALARRVPKARSTALRMAVGNIHRPGALTGPVVLSLGLGLALLVGLSLIDVNLRTQLTGTLARQAPNFFFLDIQSRDRQAFTDLVAQRAPGGVIEAVPMLRGRIVALNGTDVSKVTVAPEGKWVLNGDRGVTYSEALPANARLQDGQWWPRGYDGEPLVSFSAEEAGQLGLKRGDTVTVNVLGRPVTARIANLRAVEWDRMSINFVMVFSPNTFKGAPHAWLATITKPSMTPSEERELMRVAAAEYPAVTSVRVKDALDTVAELTGRLANAIRAAAAIALVTSILVLAGALAAGNRARLHDAVVLKTLGATRSMLIRTYVLEYGLLGVSTALFAALSGGFSAWYVVSRIMKLPFALDGLTLAVTLAVGLSITVGIGLAGTWRILGQRAAPHLREL